MALAPVLRPDMLLLDIDLPGMNGLQLVQELGAAPAQHEDRDADGVRLRSATCSRRSPAARRAT